MREGDEALGVESVDSAVVDRAIRLFSDGVLGEEDTGDCSEIEEGEGAVDEAPGVEGVATDRFAGVEGIEEIDGEVESGRLLLRGWGTR